VVVTDSIIDNQKYDYTIDEASEAIEKIFRDQGWRWWLSGPNKEDIKKMILSLQEDLSPHSSWVSSGRLLVSRDPDTGQYEVAVQFTLRE